MFALLLFNLRGQGVKVGMGEWLAFLRGVEQGLVADLSGLYQFGRAVMVHSEAQFDAWDLAFQATFEGVELPPALSQQLQDWLREARELTAESKPVDMDPEALRQLFLQRLKEQKERHDGGNRFIGTGGTSPFGREGAAPGGVQVGGGGGRSATMVAGERRWTDYRVDRTLDQRDFQVALRALRNLAREGEMELDIDQSIDRTCHNGGEIELSFDRRPENRVHVVLIMDTGGSMSPHTRLVTQLFTAAKEMKGFKSVSAYYFHNAPYGWLYTSFESYQRKPIHELMREWTPRHRVIWVGDASMADYELFTAFGGDPWSGRTSGMSGLDWLRMMQRHNPASIWLNPDPERWWDHPTVNAIRSVFPMYPLTLAGLRDGIRKLRTAL
jgi:uncharacterized protein